MLTLVVPREVKVSIALRDNYRKTLTERYLKCILTMTITRSQQGDWGERRRWLSLDCEQRAQTIDTSASRFRAFLTHAM
jgi:hypothetical protein